MCKIHVYSLRGGSRKLSSPPIHHAFLQTHALHRLSLYTFLFFFVSLAFLFRFFLLLFSIVSFLLSSCQWISPHFCFNAFSFSRVLFHRFGIIAFQRFHLLFSWACSSHQNLLLLFWLSGPWSFLWKFLLLANSYRGRYFHF